MAACSLLYIAYRLELMNELRAHRYTPRDRSGDVIYSQYRSLVNFRRYQGGAENLKSSRGSIVFSLFRIGVAAARIYISEN